MLIKYSLQGSGKTKDCRGAWLQERNRLSPSLQTELSRSQKPVSCQFLCPDKTSFYSHTSSYTPTYGVLRHQRTGISGLEGKAEGVESWVGWTGLYPTPDTASSLFRHRLKPRPRLTSFEVTLPEASGSPTPDAHPKTWLPPPEPGKVSETWG